MFRIKLFVVWIIMASHGCGKRTVVAEASQPVTAQDRPVVTVKSLDALPECTSSTEDMVVYVAASSQFRICRSGEWNVSTSASDTAKESKDSNSKPASCYVQETGQYLGTALAGCGAILFSDGISASFDANGVPFGIYAHGILTTASGSTQTSIATQCGFTTNDCSGSCYVVVSQALLSISTLTYSMSRLIKHQAQFGATAWWYTTGSEIDAGPIAMNSYADSSGCHSLSWTAMQAYRLTNVWNHPVELKLPLGSIFAGFED